MVTTRGRWQENYHKAACQIIRMVSCADGLGRGITGCGARDDGATSAELPVSGAPQSPTPTPPTSSAAATTADGSDPEACTDGNCEIAVSKPTTIRFEIPDGPATLSLTKVGMNEVGYKVTSENSRTSGTASGDGSGCLAVFTRGGSRSTCSALPDEPPDRQDGAIVLQVLAGPDGTAIVRLVSA
ncbi:hypothetical protein ACQEUU_26020 [Nonomuraea sp. CA-218870]|uniref:hypothetical protein n=1 Tax=Nonomuraea sp. CA-218870 TaxID=3239998 RepID=UPI003D902EFE